MTGLEVMIKTLRQRIERVLMFAGELAAGLRKEFQPLWGDAELDEPARQLKERIEGLQQAVERGRVAYLAARKPEPPLELQALQAIDLNALTADARGLEALARAERDRRAAIAAAAQVARMARMQATVTEKLPQGGLTGKLARWANSPSVREAAAAGLSKAREFFAEANQEAERQLAQRGQQAAPDATYEKGRQAFEAAFKLVGEILAYAAPRLGLVKVALAANGQPGRKPPWEQVAQGLLPRAREAGVPNGQMARLAHLTKQLYADQPTTVKAHQAMVQWEDAEALHGDAELLDRSLAGAPPERGKPLLAQFNVAKYRAAIFPLSHLHVAFRGVPHFGELFPAPQGVQTTASLAGMKQA